MMPVSLNARFRHRPVTGVERFAEEVSSRLSEDLGIDLREISPSRRLDGLKGHAWEQFILPRRIKFDEVLFSPCNTGPISVRRQLVVIHDAAVWDCPEAFSSGFRTVYQQLLPRLAKSAATVATVSEFSRTRLAFHLGISEEKIRLLGNAVGPEFSPGSSESGSGEDSRVHRRDSTPIFLCVGSMDPRKNLARLLRAWVSLQSSQKLPEGARLQLIGGANPNNFAGVEKIDGKGIEWLGRVDDAELIHRYRCADAFIYPSLYEGFGLPPLEAMACGCPVLLSNTASLPEVGGSLEEGATLYFDPNSEQGIASALESFICLSEESRLEMRTRALTRASRFAWEQVASRTAEMLREIAE